MKHTQNGGLDVTRFRADRASFDDWAESARNDCEDSYPARTVDLGETMIGVMLGFILDDSSAAGIASRALAVAEALGSSTRFSECPDAIEAFCGVSSRDIVELKKLFLAGVSRSLAPVDLPPVAFELSALKLQREILKQRARLDFERDKREDAEFRRESRANMRDAIAAEVRTALRPVRASITAAMREFDRKLGLVPHLAPALEASAKQGANVGRTAPENAGRTPLKSLR